MRTHAWVLFVGTMLASVTAFAGTFALKDQATGRTFGPFEMKEGQEIVIGQTKFTITQVSATSPTERVASTSGAESVLKSTTIPVANFRNASAVDCINFVQQQVRLIHRGKPINIVVRTASADSGASSPRMVTVNLQTVSAYRVLQEICEQANFGMEMSDDSVTITPRKK